MPQPGNPGSLNRYSYVLNNPLRYTDPTGHRECERYCSDEIITAGIASAYAGPWDPVAQARRMQTAQQAAGVAIDFTPVVGDAKGLVEVFTGRDLATGERLGGWRWLGLLGLSEVRHLRQADEITEVASEIVRKRIVIGEGMEAVRIAAQEHEARWYQAWSKYFIPEYFDLEKSLARNERWIREKIQQGYEILDIGIDPGRPDRSPFYELERKILEELGYPTTPIERPF